MTQRRGVTTRQIKAARALLDWSQDDLAIAAELSIATIRKLEAGNTSPRGKTNTQIQKAIELAGLEFIEPNGIRQRPEEITVYEGIDGTKEFFDDVYQTASKYGGEIVTVTPDSKILFDGILKNFTKDHFKRMSAIKHKIL